jgi:hypothetical protein
VCSTEAAVSEGRARQAIGIDAVNDNYQFPEEHRRRIRTNNPLERILREIRRRTRVVGAFPDCRRDWEWSDRYG